jgi:hypothetical protein
MAVRPKNPLALALTTNAPEDIIHWRLDKPLLAGMGEVLPEAVGLNESAGLLKGVFFMPMLLWPTGLFVLA